MIASKLSNPSRRLRALIADDDASMRRLLRVLLEGEGCTIEAVADGAEALTRARAAPPDLLVTDAVMPGMDGFSLCRAIREDPRLKRLPVLLASASFRAPYDEQLARAAGASAFLGKPATIADWQGAIHLALTSRPPQPMPDSDFTALRAKVFSELLVNRQSELPDHRARFSESETRFRDIFDNLNDLVFLVDPGSGHLFNANRRACEFLGLTKSGGIEAADFDGGAHDAFGHPCAALTELGPPEETEVVRRALRDVIEEGNGVFEGNLRRNDGVLVPYEINARRTVLEGRNVIVGVARDISERKRAEAALRQSEQRLRDLIDGLSPQMFVGLMTPEGILIEVNRPALAAAGLKREDVLGKRVDQTYWWSYSAEVQQRLHASVKRAAQGDAARYDAQVRVGENQFIYIDLSLQPLRDETGKVQYLIGSANVITERKLAEQALYESEERLRLALDAAHMGTFDWDIPASRIAWSRWHEELWGFQPGEFAGIYESFSGRVHPEDLPGINVEVERCIAAHEPFAREFEWSGPTATFTGSRAAASSGLAPTANRCACAAWKWTSRRASRPKKSSGRARSSCGCSSSTARRRSPCSTTE